jgi:hypothetical protein
VKNLSQLFELVTVRNAAELVDAAAMFVAARAKLRPLELAATSAFGT